MATIIDRKDRQYVLTFSYPETDWIKELAASMGITKESVVGAAMNYGLTHYVEAFRKEQTVDKIKGLMTDEINKPDTGKSNNHT